LEVAILRAAVNSDQFPDSVVEGAPQVVDSVGYYRGEVARKFLLEMDIDGQRAGARLGVETEAVWFLGDERGELPFDIGNVVIGPLDFLFGAIEHG
jgi:hypothetical protein